MKKLLLFLGMASTAAIAQIPSNGLQIHYSFNTASPTDNSGNGNNGNASVISYETDRFNNNNSAAKFDGTNSYISLPNSSLSSTSQSISVWFKTNTVGEVILAYQNNPINANVGGSFVNVAYVRNDSTLQAGFWQGGVAQSKHIPTKVADNNWHHIAISISSSGQQIYLDNVLVNSSTNPHTILSLPYNYIGVGFSNSSWPSLNSGKKYFSGVIDDFRKYNRTLTAAEVALLFNETNSTTSNAMRPFAAYNFNAANTRDTSGNQNHASGNNIAYTSDRFGNTNYAVSFNSTGNSFIGTPNGSFLDSTIAVSAWFKTNSVGEVLFSYRDRTIFSSGGSYVNAAYIRNDSTLQAGFWQGGVANSNHIPIKVADNNWHHLIISINNNGQKIYLDDSLVVSNTSPHTILQMPFTYIGAGVATNWPNINPGTSFFTGELDDIRFFNLELDSAAVHELFIEPSPTGQTTSISENNPELEDQLTVYPNPSNGIFSLKTKQEIQSVEVYGLSGNRLYLEQTQDNSINLSTLPKGIYFLRIVLDGVIISKKVIKN